VNRQGVTKQLFGPLAFWAVHVGSLAETIWSLTALSIITRKALWFTPAIDVAWDFSFAGFRAYDPILGELNPKCHLEQPIANEQCQDPNNYDRGKGHKDHKKQQAEK